MSNELQVINQQEVLGQDFKIYGTIENPLFLAKDVAEWIDYSKDSKGNYNVSVMLEKVDDEEKVKLYTNLNNVKVGSNTWFLTEDGLYEVLMQSRKPIAKQFKKEVKNILKDIRKHGMYATETTIDNILNDPDFGIRLLTELKEEKAKRKAVEEENKNNKPKVIFADAVATSQTSILVGELAKILKQNDIEIGEKRLFKWLRNNGYLIKRNGSDYNMPTQKSVDLGVIEIKERAINNPDGSVRVTKTPKVTGKGQQYFINKFLNNKED